MIARIVQCGHALRLLSIVWLFVLSGPTTFAAEDRSAARTQDGIVADLTVLGNQAVVRWRFLRPPEAALSDVVVSVNQSPVPRQLAPFPNPGEKAVALLMFDTSGKDRNESIGRQIFALMSMVPNPPAFLSFVYVVPYEGQGRTIIKPANDSDLLRILPELPALDIEPDMNIALQGGIAGLTLATGQRRGVYFFTDGHSKVPLDVPAIVAAARQVGAAITFVLVSGRSPVDQTDLKAIAEQTGGQVIAESDLRAFLRRPFAMLTNGGMAIAPIPVSGRYPWVSDPVVEAALLYGNKTLVLSTPANVPVLGTWETVRSLTSQRPVLSSAIAVLALAALATLTLIPLRRKRSGQVRAASHATLDAIADAPLRAQPPAAETLADGHAGPVTMGGQPAPPTLGPAPAVEKSTPQPVLAVLQDVITGVAYPVSTILANIGRSGTNEIVLPDPSVSRLHAMLQQEDSGAFSITNRSTSSDTLVNDEKITRSPLRNGDLISIGAVTLQYSQVARIRGG